MTSATGLIVVDEMDLVVLRLATTALGVERDEAYEDRADLYGDRTLYVTAASLRTRKLIGWGSKWNHCWITEDGEAALYTHIENSSKARAEAKKIEAA